MTEGLLRKTLASRAFLPKSLSVGNSSQWLPGQKPESRTVHMLCLRSEQDAIKAMAERGRVASV